MHRWLLARLGPVMAAVELTEWEASTRTASWRLVHRGCHVCKAALGCDEEAARCAALGPTRAALTRLKVQSGRGPLERAQGSFWERGRGAFLARRWRRRVAGFRMWQSLKTCCEGGPLCRALPATLAPPPPPAAALSAVPSHDVN